MGIDVCLSWSGQSDDEKKAQITGWDTEAGEVGYLREAYHGGPYATRILVPEGFEQGEFAIPAKTLRERLPLTVMTAIYRDEVVYGDGPKGAVTLTEQDDFAGALSTMIGGCLAEAANPSTEGVPEKLSPEQTAAIEERIANRQLPSTALAFVDFVALASRKESETGKPCQVYVSY